MEADSEKYFQPRETSTVEGFEKIMNGFLLLTIFAKSPRLRCLTRF